MSQAADRHTVVVGVDFSDTGDRAMAQAFEVARRYEHADVHLLSVVYDGGGDLPAAARESIFAESAYKTRERLEAHALRTLEDFGRATGAGKLARIVVHVRVGTPADQIVRLATDVDADLVIVGTHGRRGVQRLLLGSVAERVLKLAHCPVMVVRPKEAPVAEQPEPPCPACVAKRRETGGATWWCDEHSKPHEVPHYLVHTSVFRPSSPFLFGSDA